MALDRGISAVAFRLATVLLHYEGELGCFPSQERLSDDLGISVDSVQRYLRELELYGFLVVEARPQKQLSTRTAL
jgi:biotin operon repressor